MIYSFLLNYHVEQWIIILLTQADLPEKLPAGRLTSFFNHILGTVNHPRNKTLTCTLSQRKIHPCSKVKSKVSGYVRVLAQPSNGSSVNIPKCYFYRQGIIAENNRLRWRPLNSSSTEQVTVGSTVDVTFMAVDSRTFAMDVCLFYCLHFKSNTWHKQSLKYFKTFWTQVCILSPEH